DPDRRNCTARGLRSCLPVLLRPRPVESNQLGRRLGGSSCRAFQRLGRFRRTTSPPAHHNARTWRLRPEEASHTPSKPLVVMAYRFSIFRGSDAMGLDRL